MELEPKTKFEFPAEILPLNERTKEIMAEREKLEKQRQMEAEEMKLLQERADKDRKRKEKDKQREKEKKEKMAKDLEQKQREEEESMKKLEGKMLIICNNIKMNQTPKEYSLAGIMLGGPRTRILSTRLKDNITLFSLHLARKQIHDVDGVVLADMLYDNKTLRKLELEGNLLGPLTARKFGEVLSVNKTLRFLDLENNQLTQEGGQDMSGVKDFIKCLYVNNHLLSLNMGNNAMDEECGSKFEEATRVNQTLIDFEFGFNNFKLEDVRKIQDNLKRNKAMYDAERLQEWRERKRMNAEDVALKNMYLEETGKKEQDRMEEEAKDLREKELDEQWRKHLLDTEIEKQQLIQQLEEAAKIRADKGKKKKRGMGGKKKKK